MHERHFAGWHILSIYIPMIRSILNIDNTIIDSPFASGISYLRVLLTLQGQASKTFKNRVFSDSHVLLKNRTEDLLAYTLIRDKAHGRKARLSKCLPVSFKTSLLLVHHVLYWYFFWQAVDEYSGDSVRGEWPDARGGRHCSRYLLLQELQGQTSQPCPTATPGQKR